MKRRKNIPLAVLGRSDRVDLPDLGLENVQAKVDTGAYTCSLHCSQAKIVDEVLEFILLDEEHPEFTGMPFRVQTFDQREVRNSFGEAELRYVIKSRIRLHGRVIRAEFSLSNRGNLRFPVLLGRKILRHRFLIDVTKKDLSFLIKESGSAGDPSKTLS